MASGEERGGEGRGMRRMKGEGEERRRGGGVVNHVWVFITSSLEVCFCAKLGTF